MKFSVSIIYKDLFSDSDEVQICDLIKDIPTVNSIELLSYFLVQIHLEKEDKELQIDLIDFVAQRFPKEIKEKIERFYKTTRPNAEFKFIDNVSGLVFLEILLQNHNNLQRVDDLTPKQELSFFKAYLISTQKWVQKKDKIFSGLTQIKTNEDFNKAFIPTHIPYYEFNVIKDFRIQFIKARIFFEFCEKNDSFKEYLNIFLTENQVKTWQEYLKNILSLYIRKFDRLKTPSEIIVDDKYPQLKKFLSILTLDIDTFRASDDFFNIREKPIYKIDEKRFIFMNLNLFVDKIFQGIQFDFARILIKNEAKFKDKPIKRVDQFFSILGVEFSENHLFYKIMENCFSKNKYNLISGEKLKPFFIGGGEPDFYIRDKSKIYLFEFKNVFLNSNVKHSFEYDIVKNSLIEKFVKNKKGDKKGISQLIDVIHKIDCGKFSEIDNFENKNLIIYPIIIFTDISLNTPGINNLLNDEFKNLLKENKFHQLNNIKDLTMIDLDTLIKYEDLFRGKKIKINYALNNFLELTKGIGDFTKKFTSFELFMDNTCYKIDSELSRKSIDSIAEVLNIQ